MAPGRKRETSQQKPAEAPLTPYEETRALNVMRLNHRIQSLGIKKTIELLNSMVAKSKPRSRADSGSLYEAEDDEDDEEGVVDKVSDKTPKERNATMANFGGSRQKKRVMAPLEQDQPVRMTRQRTKEVTSVEEVPPFGPSATTEDALVAANSPTQADEQTHVGNEGAPDHTEDGWNRGRSMGRELDKINRSTCTRLVVHVPEGKKRPVIPLQAAKLASEGGIVLRQHIPILTNWKEYKKDQSQLETYMTRVNIGVSIDTNNKAIKEACADLLKCGQKNFRSKLKQKFFDGVPANQVRTTSPLTSMSDDQWCALVKMWSDPKHKERCEINRRNRQKVKFPQKTGSRCYAAHCYAVKKDKYKDVDPDALDLLKDTHCNSKTDCTEEVKTTIADMEAIMAEPVKEGQQPKSAADAVAQVLKSTKFLQNVGLKTAAPKRSKAAVDARVQELEGALELEKLGAADLREKYNSQEEHLLSMTEINAKQQEEIDYLKKTTDVLMRRIFLSNKEA